MSIPCDCMEKLMNLTKTLVMLASVIAGASCGSRLEERGTDSSTHFWDTCSDDAECGPGAECVCGRCTSLCEWDSDCREKGTACVGASERLDCSSRALICVPDEEHTNSIGVDASVVDVDASSNGETSVMGDASVTEEAVRTEVVTTGGDVLTTEAVTPTTDLVNLTTDGVPDTRAPLTSASFAGEVSSPDSASCLDEEGCPWTSRAPFPEQILRPVTASRGTKFYAFGGLHRGDLPPDATGDDLQWDPEQRESYVYDAITNQWSALTSAPEDVSWSVGGVIADTVYIVRGAGLPLLSYDISSDASSLGETPSVDLNEWGETGATVVDGKLYVVGSIVPAGNGYETTVHFYDPETAQWTSIANLPAPARSTALCGANSRLYSFGSAPASAPREDTGEGSLDELDSTDKTWIYDIASNSWSEGTAESPRRGRHFCATIGDVIYVAGGDSDIGWLRTLRRYYPATDAWEDVAPLPGEIALHQPQVVDGQLYALSDAPDRGVNALWRFTPTP